jgi:hypothetical protein
VLRAIHSWGLEEVSRGNPLSNLWPRNTRHWLALRAHRAGILFCFSNIESHEQFPFFVVKFKLVASDFPASRQA